MEQTFGGKYDLEIQRVSQGRRPAPGQIPNTIFIVEEDFYHMGEPVYPIERINLTTGNPFNEGERFLYVNGEYQGASDIGKLINRTDADDMNFDLMAERTRYLKENPEGVSEMSRPCLMNIS